MTTGKLIDAGLVPSRGVLINGATIQLTEGAADEVTSRMLGQTVAIWPVDELLPDINSDAMQPTPENMLHLQARLAAAEDSLARETRGCQAAHMVASNCTAMWQSSITAEKELRAENSRLRDLLHRHGLSADTSD